MGLIKAETWSLDCRLHGIGLWNWDFGGLEP